MGSSGNLSKLTIPKPHWQEGKDKAVYMNVGYCNKETMGPDSRGAGALRSKMRWWVVCCLYAVLVVVPLLMFVCAIDNMEAIGSKRQPWISLDTPRLEFIGVRSRWGLLRGGREAVASNDESKPRAALQGMGTLLRLGTRAMQELVVAHLTEDTTSEELRLFLRSLHRSGSTARADTVLLFPSSPMPAAMATVIDEEENSFQKLLSKFKPENDEAPSGSTVTEDSTCTDAELLTAPFNAVAFKRRSEDEQQELAPEIIWGRRHGNASATTTTTEEGEVGNPSHTSWATWGSVVAFDVQELDSQDALQGFLDTPPVQLRRWLCYDMLLGMIKSRYKNVMVSQVKGVYVLGDALSAVRAKQTLYVTSEDVVWRDAKREPVAASEPGSPLQPDISDDAPRLTVVDLPAVRYETIRRSLRESSKLKSPDDDDDDDVLKIRETQSGLIQSVYGSRMWNTLESSEKQHAVVSPAVILGAVCYVRGLASKMTSEIVRVAMERKSRRSFHDKAVLNMWVRKKAALGKRIADHLKVVKNHNSVVHSLPSSLSSSSPSPSSLSPSPSSSSRKRSRHLVVHDQNQDSPSELRHNLCRLDPSVYQQCS